MELKHQLAGQLRQLRLSGVLETMEARHRQAIDGQWNYTEFLSRLLEDEVERRAQKQLNLRLRRGALNTTKTLEGFDFHFNPHLNRQQILQLASCEFVRQKRNLLICGPTGVGKSHLAQALGQEGARQGLVPHQATLDKFPSYGKLWSSLPCVGGKRWRTRNTWLI